MPLSLEEQHELVLKNQKFVYFLVNKLAIDPSDYDDVVSIGKIGLIKAAATFDETQKIQFSTYASRCINNEIFMHYRKASKYVNDISLSQPFTANKDGEELPLEESLEDPDSDFTERILDKETFIKLFSIVLNYLNSIEQYTILYRLADITQRGIAKMLNFSRSYVCRLESNAIRKIRECLKNNIKFQEVFSVASVGNIYKISFSSKDIHSFNKIFASLLQNITSVETLPDFKVDCSKERIVVLLPSSSKSFSFLAKMMQEIDSFRMTFVSDKEDLSANDVKSLEAVANDQADVFQEANVNVTEVPDVQGKDSTFEDASSTSTMPERVALKGDSQSKQIRDYVFSKDSFTAAELKENFPKIKEGTIFYVLNRLKKQHIVTPTSRGQYKVNKT